MRVVIEKLQIDCFGKLKNVSFSAESGINLLSAPNETGKSTLAAFIKYAFYGFAGGRKHDLLSNERKLYTPWDGEICEGKLAFTADGEKYLLHRRTSATGKEACTVVNRVTGKNEFVGVTVGEAVFGVTEEIFTRTLFFGQLTLPPAEDNILAERLRDIAITADELVSTKRALKKLTEAKNELKGKAGNGLLPKTIAQRDALEEEINGSESHRNEAARLKNEIAKRNQIINSHKEKSKAIINERKNIDSYEALQKLQSLSTLKAEAEQAKADYQIASAGVKKQASGEAFGVLTSKNAALISEQRNAKSLKERLDTANQKYIDFCAEGLLSREQAEKAQASLSLSKRLSAVFFALAAALAVAGAVLAATLSPAIGVALAVASLALGGISVIYQKKPKRLAKNLGFSSILTLKQHLLSLPQRQQQASAYQAEIANLEQQYNQSASACEILSKELELEISAYTDTEIQADYSAQIQQILAMSAHCGEKLALWQAKQQGYESAIQGVDLDQLAQVAQNAQPPLREKQTVDMEINFYAKQLEVLSELNRKDEVALAAAEARAGDISVLVAKRDSLNALIEDYRLKHKAYETAIQLINDSGSYMKAMIAPRISARADEYFVKATNGKYSGLSIDTNVAMSFDPNAQRSCEYLSAGTRDSAYLSLRLALADLLFADGAPIILDDAFSHMDDDRLSYMLNAISDSAANHQIFLFSHGNRESNLLTSAGINYTASEINRL